ncbi:DUF998 domain-containing protein [Chloroflexota bacterium]
MKSHGSIPLLISKLSDQSSQNPGLMTISFIIYGAFIICFSYALYFRIQRGVKAYITWFALTLYGSCMILAGIFQDTAGLGSDSLNLEGFIHNTVIIISNISILIGMWMFAGSVYKKPSWFGFTWFTIGASILGLVLSIIFAVQTYIPASGLLQHFFYLVLLIWVEKVATWLFRLSFKPE